MKVRFAAAGLVLIMFGLLTSTLPVTSPTVDEPMYITRGYAFVSRGQDRMAGCSPCSPALSSALSGLTLLLEPHLKPLPPAEDPLWSDNGGTGIIEYFVWAEDAPTARIIFLARLPIVFVAVMLGALIFRWAAQRSGQAAALAALVVYTFCPNMLAHGRLVTADVVTAATFTLSAYLFDQALRQAALKWRVRSGVALGLALASKVSAVALPVAFTLWAIIVTWPHRSERRRWRAALTTTLLTIVVGGLTVWGIYRFSFGPIDPGGPDVPAPAYWGDWQAVIRNQSAPLPAYLFGEISTRGWWYYYPIVFLAKTPLPVLILLVLSLARMLFKRQWAAVLPLWIVPLAIFGGLLFSAHDLGYRYVLPVLPFVFVASAEVFAAVRFRRGATIGLLGLIVWQIVGTLSIYPYYLAFFNEAAGGPDHGRFVLSDSNLDWGQDLPGLKTYLEQNALADFNLSYFGGIDPAVYGLHGYALPPVRAAMRTQGPWWLHRFYPPDPAPGVYAISASNLMGGAWIDPGAYAFFRARSPNAVIGHSIYLYTIAPRGETANLSLAGLQVDQIDANTYRLFETNDVRPRWFDAGSSLVAAPDRAWIALANDQPLAVELAPLFADVKPVALAATIDDQRPYALYHFDLGQRLLEQAHHSEQAAQAAQLPVKFGDTAELLGFRVTPAQADLTLMTFWRVDEPAITPLQLFVHVLRSDGSIAAQADRLDASPFGWRTGDLIAQVHHLALPPQAGTHTIAIGLYNSDSGVRLPIVSNGRAADQLILKQIEAK